MKKALITLLLATSILRADPTAEPVQTSTNEHIRPDVPFETRPYNSNEEGISITYLVEGENLSEFKENSVHIDSIEAANGVKLPKKLATKVVSRNQQSASKDGCYARFSINIPVEQAGLVLKSLKLKGSIVMFAGGEIDDLPSTTIPESKNTSVTVGAFKVRRETTDIHSKEKQPLRITITGPVETIKEITVSQGDVASKNSSWSTSKGSITRYYYDIDSNAEAKIKIVAWKNRKETKVPFAYGY